MRGSAGGRRRWFPFPPGVDSGPARRHSPGCPRPRARLQVDHAGPQRLAGWRRGQFRSSDCHLSSLGRRRLRSGDRPAVWPRSGRSGPPDRCPSPYGTGRRTRSVCIVRRCQECRSICRTTCIERSRIVVWPPPSSFRKRSERSSGAGSCSMPLTNTSASFSLRLATQVLRSQLGPRRSLVD